MLLLDADRVGPEARRKLRGLLEFYRKKPHPFRACVRDNTKRFGKEGAERICATLKDLMVGNTRWRKGGGKKTNLSEEEDPSIDEELGSFLMNLSDEQYQALELVLWDEV